VPGPSPARSAASRARCGSYAVQSSSISARGVCALPNHGDSSECAAVRLPWKWVSMSACRSMAAETARRASTESMGVWWQKGMR